MRSLRLPQLASADLGRPQFRHRNPKVLEGTGYVFREPRYDVYLVTVNTALDRQRLFQIPQGQQYTPTGGAALTKTEWHTNMTTAGTLPNPQKFFIKAVSVAIRPDTDVQDATRFLYDTLVTLKIQRPLLEQHAILLPGLGGLYGGSSAIVSNGLPDARSNFQTFGEEGETIEQLQQFEVALDPTRVKDAAGNGTYTLRTTAAGGFGINCFVRLDGLLWREVL